MFLEHVGDYQIELVWYPVWIAVLILEMDDPDYPDYRIHNC